MTVSRTNGPKPTFLAKTTGSQATLTVHRAGLVKLATMGTQHVVVDHVSYYLDITVAVYPDGMRFNHTHVVYRHGDQDDAVTEEQRERVLDLVRGWIEELLELAADEVGLLAPVNADEAEASRLRVEIFTTESSLGQMRKFIVNLEGRQRQIQDQLVDLREEEAGRQAYARELREQLHTLLAKQDTAAASEEANAETAPAEEANA